jgi:hypothetical protein
VQPRRLLGGAGKLVIEQLGGDARARGRGGAAGEDADRSIELDLSAVLCEQPDLGGAQIDPRSVVLG